MQKLSIPTDNGGQRSRAHSHSRPNSRSRPHSRSRSASNPWNRYADFFKNKSFLIPDIVAFDKIKPYFKSIPDYNSKFEITLVELVGYEAYFVEQWIASRSNNTLIVTYTGDPNDRIVAYHVLSLSSDKKPSSIHENSNQSNQNNMYDHWPLKFISYLVEQLESPFYVPTDTSMGYAFITNLAQLNPFLSLIDAKTGNISDDYTLFMVNYNLKKLGCGSRSAATTDEPSKSMENKFKSTFKIDSKIPINYSVLNLIYTTQIFLYYYGFIDPIYCDGLFCEKTETAINEWWKIMNEIPMALNMLKDKPPNCNISDSIKGIVGITILCRNLLEIGGNNFGVPKDLLDYKQMKLTILRFQKHFKLEQTSCFNHETLLKLIDWGNSIKTSQNLTKDLSKMKKIVKNTVIDITSGKNLQSIAQNASASPFFLHSHTNFDQGKLINCQNIDHFSNFTLGKSLNYLFKGNGKPIDMSKNILAVEANRKLANSTNSISVLDGVKKMKSQLNLPPLNNNSNINGFFDLKNISQATLGLFDGENSKDYENAIVSDSESTKAKDRVKSKTKLKSKPSKSNSMSLENREKYQNQNQNQNQKTSEQKSNSLTYNDDNNINQHIKKSSRIVSPPYLSSDDEYNYEYKSKLKSSTRHKNKNDYIEEFNNDISTYTPNKKSTSSGKSDLMKLNSLDRGQFSANTYDDFDSDYVSSGSNTRHNSRSKDRGSSFTSHFRLTKKSHNDMINIDEAITDDDTDSMYSKTRINSKKLNDGNLKTVFASPHVISTGEFSGNNSRMNSVHKLNNSNEFDSDGVYEYEDGFEYDYEVDGQAPHKKNSSNSDDIKEHSRKQSLVPSIQNDNERNGVKIINNNNNDNNNNNKFVENQTALSTQSNITTSSNYYNDNSNKSVDYQYLQFSKRLKRRHSIPIVDSEANKYSIEMKMKMKRESYNKNSNGLEKKTSWVDNKKNMKDFLDMNSINSNNETNYSEIKDGCVEKSIDDKLNGVDKFKNNTNMKGENLHDNSSIIENSQFMKRNQSILGSRSYNTITNIDNNYCSQEHYFIHSKPIENIPLRRCASFSLIDNNLSSQINISDVYGFEYSGSGFLTSEVLAMKYLKLKSKYQISMVQKSFEVGKELQLHSLYVLESMNPENNIKTLKINNTRHDANLLFSKFFELEDKLKNANKSNARLKYELRLLLQRTKEVENNLKILQDFKINTLNSKIDKLVKDLNVQKDINPEITKNLLNKDNHNSDIVCSPFHYREDGTVDWSKFYWANIWHNPYVLVYLGFHFIMCAIIRLSDSKAIEEKWKKIDKNQTVTTIIKKLYAKSEMEMQKTDECCKISDHTIDNNSIDNNELSDQQVQN